MPEKQGIQAGPAGDRGAPDDPGGQKRADPLFPKGIEG